jgi:hypothetical protein
MKSTDFFNQSDYVKAAGPARWNQERRLEFIDFRLQWGGRLNRADLTAFFGISIPQASLDLARYMELAPNNIRYDKRAKIYKATPEFVPALTSNDPQSYLTQLLVVSKGILAKDSSFCGWLPPVGMVQQPYRQIKGDVLKLALKAIHTSQMLHIKYQSMSRSVISQRPISPHAFGFDGFRWHLRAYCHEKQDFRDFVFSRMLDVSLGGASDIDFSKDEEWFREVELVLAPHPKLSEAQQRTIELDYGMQSGRTVLRTRQALLFYVLRQLHLNDTDSSTPQKQQIVLVNREELLSLRAGTA